jgi:hypothetical protein
MDYAHTEANGVLQKDDILTALFGPLRTGCLPHHLLLRADVRGLGPSRLT